MTDLKNALTLAQIGQRLVAASKELTAAERRALSFEELMRRLNLPVGTSKPS